METILANVLKEVGSTAVILAIIAWLARSIINHWLDQRIDSHKEEIRNQSEKEIEDFKAKLQVDILERNIVFQNLSVKRTEIISELYKLLRKAYNSAYFFGGSTIFGTHRLVESKAEMTIENLREFYLFYSEHKIYFTEELDEKIDNFFSLIYETTNGYLEIDNWSEGEQLTKDRNEYLTSFVQKLSDIESDLTSLMKSIEIEFRKITGAKIK